MSVISKYLSMLQSIYKYKIRFGSFVLKQVFAKLIFAFATFSNNCVSFSHPAVSVYRTIFCKQSNSYMCSINKPKKKVK